SGMSRASCSSERKERTMIELYDHIQQLRAELRGCYFTRRERAAVQAELTSALAEQAKLDRAFDSAFEALQNAEAIRAAEDDIRRESEFLFRCYSDPTLPINTLGAMPIEQVRHSPTWSRKARFTFSASSRATSTCRSVPIRRHVISSIEHTFSTGRQVSTAVRMRSW